MKIRHSFIPAIILLFSISVLAEEVPKKYKHKNFHIDCLQEAEVDIDNDVIVFTCEYDHDLWVEITPDYDLYVNGEHIELNRRQQRMVAEYYDNFMEIIDQAKVIGKEGAKIGMEGAKIGLAAAGAALKMLACDYDSDDLEEEISDDVEALEERAEELEEMAEELEERADEFEDLHYSMKREIRALNKLAWF